MESTSSEGAVKIAEMTTTLKFAASIDYSFHNFSAACIAVG